MIGKLFIFLIFIVLVLANVDDCGIDGKDCECGTATPSKLEYYEGMARPWTRPRHKRAFGSRRSKEGDWPWAAMLKFPGKSRFTCSGSIVGKKWILTAGNCADKSVEGFPAVFFGNPTINLMIDRKVKQVHKHSKFDRIDVNFINDLALVELEKEIDFNDKVHNICIIKNLKENKKEIAVFAGYGDFFYYIKNKDLVKKNGKVIDPDDLFTRPAESLQETPIALQPWEECKMTVENSTIDKKTVCGGKTAHGTTKGDAGGPLMLIRNKKWTLFGIASTGRYESIQDDRLAMDHFGLYTKVGEYCDWLETTTKQEVKCLVS